MRSIIFVSLLALSLNAIADKPKLAHVIRFTDYQAGSVEDWLQKKGFNFKEDAQKRNLIDLDINNGSLTIEAKRQAFGIMPNETVNVPEFTFIEIDWGVRKFPKGASYAQGVRNEAIMVMVFMGDENQPSGSMFIPDSPYFIGLYLCHGDDKMDHPYVGAFFKKGGRYVCGSRPEVNKVVTSRFNLLKAYRTYFDKEKDDDPAVSGIAIALDTKKAGDGGKSSAFIQEIRFYH